ncbi:hypothetical protein SLS62_011110 [Diatrype stigma]|uniref:Chromo domain-containing protein n=1 Tax=Diatrype stigma TaxID=117547 RepID=A0AAN9U4Y9_9PEZI
MADHINRSQSRKRRTPRSTADLGRLSHRDPVRASGQTKRSSNSSFPPRPESAADAYRHRLRQGRREASEAAERDGATASFGTSSYSNGSRTTTVHPPARVIPAKIKDNGQYAYNGESWWLVERIFAARDEPGSGGTGVPGYGDGGPIQRGELQPPARRQVLVKWVGWPKPTWEPLSNLEGKYALADFMGRHGNPEFNDGPAEVYQRWFTY